MARIVQKFGGTSVGDVDRIRNVAKRVAREVHAGNEVAVVVSAMAGATNQLVDWCRETSRLHDAREYDVVVAAGEQVTAGLLALALQDLGIVARSWLGWQIPIHTDGVHGKARIDSIDTAELSKRLAEGEVAVVAGFQGIGPRNRITTLGRGGSDTSAVALAAALKADRCDIFTDVDGVYTTDPRIVAKARKLDRITYEEMLEMASQGAKVLQTRSVEMAMNHRVRVQVLSSFADLPGTLVVDEEEIVEKQVVSGIAYSRDEAKITLQKVADRPGVAAAIFGPLADASVNVDMIVQNVSDDGRATDLTFTVARADLDRAVAVLEKSRETLGFSALKPDSNVVKISVIGVGMRSHAGIAKQMFQTLADKGINIQVISTSEIKVSVLIAAEYTELALRALHTVYGLDAGRMTLRDGASEVPAEEADGAAAGPDAAARARLDRLWQRGRDFFGCRLAIMGGAMTWVSERHLVAAISNAGGFGVIASGSMSPDLLSAEIEATKARTSRPFGVNLITLHPQLSELIDVCIAQRIGHVVLAGGLPPSAAIGRLKVGGAQVLCFAPALAIARKLVRLGVDAIIIEGSEAGGHIGPVSTAVLAQEILPYPLGVPVFVAGGIGRGEAMLSYLEMGAAGVQLGTRFVCARESIAHERFKHAFIRAAARDAVPSVQLDPRFPVIPVRALANPATENFLAMQRGVIERFVSGAVSQREAQLEIEHFWAGALRRAVIEGDVETGSLMAGQSVGFVTREQSTADILEELVAQAAAQLRARDAADRLAADGLAADGLAADGLATGRHATTGGWAAARVVPAAGLLAAEEVVAGDGGSAVE